MPTKYKILNLCLILIIISLTFGIVNISKALVEVGGAVETSISSTETADLCSLDVIYCDTSIEGIIAKSAKKYGVDANLMIRIAKAESELNPSVIGKITSEDRGLFQINSRWHLKDDDVCAFDPYCSSDWTASKIALGGIGLWSASREKWE
jgi:hypothetical protein